MTKLLMIVSIVLLGFGCAERTASKAETANTAIASSEPPAVKRHLIPFEQVYPTVGLKEYTLVTDSPERDRADANAVIRAKIGLPYAMHTKKWEDFERILGRNFIFTAADEHFDREGYIANRGATHLRSSGQTIAMSPSTSSAAAVPSSPMPTLSRTSQAAPASGKPI